MSTQNKRDYSLFGDEHVHFYQETDGDIGYDWNGAHILLLTTKGRHSGVMHTTPLIFTRQGDGWSVIASKGGAPEHPAWYLNILANPRVQVQVKGDVYDATARTAQSPEREKIWADAIKAWPEYDGYQENTDRKIPVVVLQPVQKV